MIPEHHFNAPWGGLLKLTTSLSVLILAGIPILTLVLAPPLSGITLIALVVLPLLVLFAGLLFMVRGYRVTADHLTILRPGWSTDIPLAELHGAAVDPQAMKRSFRIFGNGGMFVFAGRFHNRHLGRYRAFATDPKLSVVLRFTDRMIVVTPDHPDRFAASILASIQEPL